MSEINISIFSRLLSVYLQETPDVGQMVDNIRAAANGDGQANDEDQVLTDVEARRFIELQREQGRTLRTRLGLLTSRRDALVGTLQAAQETLRRANAPEEILDLIQRAAGQDNDPANLSLPEISEAIRYMEQTAQALERLNGDEFFREVQGLARDLRELEGTGGEILFPEGEAAQRAPVDLNFLKSLEQGDWQAIIGLASRLQRGERIDPRDVQIRFYMTVLTLINVAGIDPTNRDADWRLTIENIQAAMRENPAEAGENRESPERTLANFRYAADYAQQDLGRLQGEVLLGHPERNDLGVSLFPLFDQHPELFARDPRLQLFRDESGADGILTYPELARSLRHFYYSSGATPPNPSEVMNELRVLVTAHQPETPAADAARARAGDPFIREMNRLVMGDLQHMLDGYTERDRQLVDTMEAWDLVPRVASNVVTLGGLTTGGETYVEVRQGFAELAATRRTNALSALRRLLEFPDAASGFPAIPNFQTWLSRRTGAAAQVSIPNALEYLRSTQPNVAAMLDGPFFHATRLWNIRRETDADRQARLWMGLAADLRSGARGEGVTSVLHSVPNLAFARAILHAVRRETTNPEIRSQARVAFQDSMGEDITDDSGNVVTRGRGELGLFPVDWFRNYSDESVATIPSDAVFLGATIYAGGSAVRGFTGLMTAAGRRQAMVGLSEFTGIRSTLVVGSTVSESVAANSPGWFGRWLIRGAEGRVAAAEARLSNAVTAAERVEAQQGLARARMVQRVLSAPTLTQGLAESGAVGSAVATGLRVGSFGARLAGRAWDRVILPYMIAYAVFPRIARRQRFAPIFDREFSVELPERRTNASMPNPATSGSGVNTNSQRNSSRPAERSATPVIQLLAGDAGTARQRP